MRILGKNFQLPSLIRRRNTNATADNAAGNDGPQLNRRTVPGTETAGGPPRVDLGALPDPRIDIRIPGLNVPPIPTATTAATPRFRTTVSFGTQTNDTRALPMQTLHPPRLVNAGPAPVTIDAETQTEPVTIAEAQPEPVATENIDRFVAAQRRDALTQRMHVIAQQLVDGPAILGETHTSPDARAVVLDMISAGSVRELFVELGSLQLGDLGLDPCDIPASGHDRSASDFLREHAGEDLNGHPVWEALAEGLQWVDVHPNAIPLVQLIDKAQVSGVAVYFYDNETSHDRMSTKAMSRRNEVAGRDFQRAKADGKAGTVMLVGSNHLSAQRCGGADKTIQTACGVAPQRVHDLG